VVCYACDMKLRFTRHAAEKLSIMERFGFIVSTVTIKKTVNNPLRLEERQDGTYIAMSLLDKTHVLRVVYRVENDIMVIITFYPGRRKAYEV